MIELSFEVFSNTLNDVKIPINAHSITKGGKSWDFYHDYLDQASKRSLTAWTVLLVVFKMSPKEKEELKLQLETLLQKRDSDIEQTIRAELAAKEKVLVAELQQGDRYTKRARPTVVYAGLAMIFLNYCVIPLANNLAGNAVTPFKLPTEFWAAWGGIVSTWVVGRSAEKWGARNRALSAITGTHSPETSLLD